MDDVDARFRRDAPSGMGLGYYRHGTLSLYAALDTKAGRVHLTRHTSPDSLAFLKEVVSLCPPRQEIHIILDNLSAYRTQAFREFLEQRRSCSFTSPHLFLLAQQSRDLVRQDRTPRSLHAASSPLCRIWRAGSDITIAFTQGSCASLPSAWVTW